MRHCSAEQGHGSTRVYMAAHGKERQCVFILCMHVLSFSKENPADIEPYEMTYLLWTLDNALQKSNCFLFPFHLLCFFPLNVTGKVLKVVDLC